jgi:hypothetical protein
MLWRIGEFAMSNVVETPGEIITDAELSACAPEWSADCHFGYSLAKLWCAARTG